MAIESPPVLYIENGIIFEYHEDEVVTVELAYYAASERKRLAGNNKMPVMVSFKRLFGFTTETREMDLDVILANMSALAFYIEDNENKIPESEKKLILTFYETTPYPVPVKVFFDKSEAVDWLQGYIEK